MYKFGFSSRGGDTEPFGIHSKRSVFTGFCLLYNSLLISFWILFYQQVTTTLIRTLVQSQKRMMKLFLAEQILESEKICYRNIVIEFKRDAREKERIQINRQYCVAANHQYSSRTSGDWVLKRKRKTCYSGRPPYSLL